MFMKAENSLSKQEFQPQSQVEEIARRIVKARVRIGEKPSSANHMPAVSGAEVDRKGVFGFMTPISATDIQAAPTATHDIRGET